MILTHTEVTDTMFTVHTTLDYAWIQTQEQRYWSGFGTYKVWGVQMRSRNYKMCKVPINMTGDVVEACSVHVSMRIFYAHAFMAINRYTFHSFLALNSTHIISEVSNSISTFVLILTIIFLSFVDWRCGWSMFCTCEYENFPCTCIL